MKRKMAIPIKIIYREIPLVSVVMPAYNSEKYIAETIESVLNQTYKNFEFIIINDASTDKTLDIIKKYAKKDKRIKVIENKKNLGITKTRNKGLELAKGKYVATHDSDDISLPTRFEEQVEYLESHPEVGAVGAYIRIFDEVNKKISIRKYPKNDKELRKLIYFCCPIAQPVSMIRKSILDKIGGYRKIEAPSEDLYLWFKIGEKSKFANIQKVLLNYRYYPNSTTGSKLRLMEKRANKIRWRESKSRHYHFGVKAFVYNFSHFISLYIIPSKFKLWLFTRMRDSKR